MRIFVIFVKQTAKHEFFVIVALLSKFSLVIKSSNVLLVAFIQAFVRVENSQVRVVIVLFKLNT